MKLLRRACEWAVAARGRRQTCCFAGGFAPAIPIDFAGNRRRLPVVPDVGTGAGPRPNAPLSPTRLTAWVRCPTLNGLDWSAARQWASRISPHGAGPWSNETQPWNRFRTAQWPEVALAWRNAPRGRWMGRFRPTPVWNLQIWNSRFVHVRRSVLGRERSWLKGAARASSIQRFFKDWAEE